MGGVFLGVQPLASLCLQLASMDLYHHCVNNIHTNQYVHVVSTFTNWNGIKY